MRKVIIVGAGGHCKSVIDAILSSKGFDEIIVTDLDGETERHVIGDIYISGSDDIIADVVSKWELECAEYGAFIGVGGMDNLAYRKEIEKRIAVKCKKFLTIIDPSAVVSSHSRIEEGVFIGKLATVNAGAVIGRHAIINTGAIIEHDCVIGEFSHIAVGAKICGGTEVGDNTFVGAGAIVIQGITIGKDSVIGAGSIVLRDVPEDTRVLGLYK